jgi:hypothetical protein
MIYLYFLGLEEGGFPPKTNTWALVEGSLTRLLP